MSMSFPNIESLVARAEQRGFRMPKENESTEQYRSAFAEFMKDVDLIESFEIKNGGPGLGFAEAVGQGI